MISFIVQILYWALFYIIIGEFNNLATSFYFSAVTFATLGYGDIVLTNQWRIVSSMEAITGMLMGGFAASVFFSITFRLFNFHRKSE